MPRFLDVLLAGLLLSTSMTYAGVTPAERLGEAIQFQTVSYQDHSQIDLNEFERFHAFLRAAQ